MSKCIRCHCEKEDIAYYCYECQKEVDKEKVEERRHKELINAIKGAK